MEVLLAKLSAISGWLAGAFGSALALLFNRKNVIYMRKMEIFITFISGVLISHLIGGAIVEIYDIKLGSFVADSIKMTIGVTGMGMLARLYEKTPQILDKWLNK